MVSYFYPSAEASNVSTLQRARLFAKRRSRAQTPLPRWASPLPLCPHAPPRTQSDTLLPDVSLAVLSTVARSRPSQGAAVLAARKRRRGRKEHRRRLRATPRSPSHSARRPLRDGSVRLPARSSSLPTLTLTLTLTLALTLTLTLALTLIPTLTLTLTLTRDHLPALLARSFFDSPVFRIEVWG